MDYAAYLLVSLCSVAVTYFLIRLRLEVRSTNYKLEATRAAVAKVDERTERLEKYVGSVKFDMRDMKQDLAEVVLHGRRTDEVTTRTGLLVKQLATNGQTPAPEKAKAIDSSESIPTEPASPKQLPILTLIKRKPF